LDASQILPERREVLRPDGRPCGLTSAEFDILQILAGERGRGVTRDEICRHVFRRPYRVGDRTVDMLVARLRRTIELIPAQPQTIKTVRSIGYDFAGFAPAPPAAAA
jgi:DNA-binding response OmpR family regulator